VPQPGKITGQARRYLVCLSFVERYHCASRHSPSEEESIRAGEGTLLLVIGCRVDRCPIAVGPAGIGPAAATGHVGELGARGTQIGVILRERGLAERERRSISPIDAQGRDVVIPPEVAREKEHWVRRFAGEVGQRKIKL
jgi:hypothetical protein